MTDPVLIDSVTHITAAKCSHLVVGDYVGIRFARYRLDGTYIDLHLYDSSPNTIICPYGSRVWWTSAMAYPEDPDYGYVSAIGLDGTENAGGYQHPQGSESFAYGPCVIDSRAFLPLKTAQNQARIDILNAAVISKTGEISIGKGDFVPAIGATENALAFIVTDSFSNPVLNWLQFRTQSGSLLTEIELASDADYERNVAATEDRFFVLDGNLVKEYNESGMLIHQIVVPSGYTYLAASEVGIYLANYSTPHIRVIDRAVERDEDWNIVSDVFTDNGTTWPTPQLVQKTDIAVMRYKI